MAIKLTEARLRQIIREEVARVQETSAYDKWLDRGPGGPDDGSRAGGGRGVSRPSAAGASTPPEPRRYATPDDGLTPEQKAKIQVVRSELVRNGLPIRAADAEYSDRAFDRWHKIVDKHYDKLIADGIPEKQLRISLGMHVPYGM